MGQVFSAFCQRISPLWLRSVTRMPPYSAISTRSPGSTRASCGPKQIADRPAYLAGPIDLDDLVVLRVHQQGVAQDTARQQHGPIGQLELRSLGRPPAGPRFLPFFRRGVAGHLRRRPVGAEPVQIILDWGWPARPAIRRPAR